MVATTSTLGTTDTSYKSDSSRAAIGGDKTYGGADDKTASIGRTSAPRAGAADLSHREAEMLNAYRNYVKERPLVTLAVALGAGYLIGRLLG